MPFQLKVPGVSLGAASQSKYPARPHRTSTPGFLDDEEETGLSAAKARQINSARADDRLEWDMQKDVRDAARAELAREYVVIKDAFDRHDKLIKDSSGAGYYHQVALKNNTARSLSPFWQKRMAGYLTGSVGSEKDQKLRAYRAANPAKPQPGLKEVQESSTDASTGVKSFSSRWVTEDVDKLTLANWKLGEAERISGEKSIITGQPAKTNHFVQVDDEHYATRDANGVPNLISKKEHGLKEQAQELGLEMSDFHGGVFEKSVDVQTPMGKMVHTYIYPGKGLYSPSELKKSGFMPDGMGNMYTTEINPSDAEGKEARANMTKRDELVQSVVRDYSRLDTKGAWDNLEKEETDSARLLDAFKADRGSGGEAFALDKLGAHTGGVWLLMGKDKSPWKTHMFSHATWVRGAQEKLVHFDGAWDYVKTKSGTLIKMLRKTDGNIVHYDQIIDPTINIEAWQENINKARDYFITQSDEDLGGVIGQSGKAYTPKPTTYSVPPIPLELEF